MKKSNVVLGLALACSLGTAHAAFSPSPGSSEHMLRVKFDAENYPFEMQENKYYGASMDFQANFKDIDYVCFTPTFKESGAPHVRLYNKQEVPGYSRGDATTSGQRRCSGSPKFAESFKDGQARIEFKARDFEKNNTPSVTLQDLIITIIGKVKHKDKIETCGQLISTLEDYEATQDAKYLITKDLDCTASKPLNIKHNLSEFHLDGQGHTIKGLRIVGSLLNKGMFNSSIKDLTFMDPVYDTPNDKKSYLISNDFINQGSSISQVSIENPSNNGIPMTSIFREFRDSTLEDFTLKGAGMEFDGESLVIRGAVRGSKLSNVKINSVKHVAPCSNQSSLLAQRSDGTQFHGLEFDDITVDWAGALSNYRAYSFLIGDSNESNTINGIKFGNITYPGPSKHVALLANNNRENQYAAENSYSNIEHKFWAPGEEPLFPLFFKNKFDVVDQITSNVRPADEVEPVLPPEVCKPYVARDTYFGLPGLTAK